MGVVWNAPERRRTSGVEEVVIFRVFQGVKPPRNVQAGVFCHASLRPRLCQRCVCGREGENHLTSTLFALASVMAERSYNRFSVLRDHATDEGTGYIPARCEMPSVPDAFSILLSDAMSCCERLSLTGL